MSYSVLTRAVIAKASALQGKPVSTDIINMLAYPHEADGSQNIGFLGALPGMAEIGQAGIKLEDIAEYDFAIKNKEYGVGVPVHERELSRDLKNSGVLRKALNDLANAPSRHMRNRIVDLIEAGGSLPTGGNTTFDGKAFFSTTHSYNKSVYTTNQSNDLAASAADAAAPTATEVKAAIDAVRTAFNTLKNDKGEIFHDAGQAGLVAIIPDKYRSVFEDVLLVKDLPAGGQNKYFQMMRLHVEPRLTSANNIFYVAKVDGGEYKPLIKQWETIGGKAFRSSITKDDDSYTQTSSRKLWTIKGSYELGYYLWQFMARVTFS